METIFCETSAGLIQGYTDKKISVYRGIPYALPPMGSLRFRPPQPITTTQSSLYNKPDYYGAAAQPERIGNDGTAMVEPQLCNEDCLYLNIFTPKHDACDTKLRPVMVWLHGGSAMYGSANQPIHDGVTLARQGIIVVTVNYRTGLFGYLELGERLGDDYAGSGNNATHDQMLALQWVHQHIKAFGGDPKKITLAGESSGAKAVACLLSIEPARDLVKRAIIASGTGDCVHSLDQANRVAALFVDHLPTPLTSETLSSLDTTTLLAAQQLVVGKYENTFPFRPVIDGKLLTDLPVRMLEKADLSNLEILSTFNHDDGWFQLSPNGHRYRDCVNETKPVGRLTHFNRAQARSLLQQANSEEPQQTLLQQISDIEYIQPGLQLLRTSIQSGATGYAYQFNFSPATGPFAGYCVHASELPYIWGNFEDPYMQDFAPLGAYEYKQGTMLMQAWVSFIKTGIPTTENGNLPASTSARFNIPSFEADGLHDRSDEIEARYHHWLPRLGKV